MVWAEKQPSSELRGKLEEILGIHVNGDPLEVSWYAEESALSGCMEAKTRLFVSPLFYFLNKDYGLTKGYIDMRVVGLIIRNR